MDQKTISIVQFSWKKINAITPNVAEVFYKNLFTDEPSFKKLFIGNAAAQHRAFNQTVNIAVYQLNDLNTLIPILQGLARRHDSYGVKKSYYESVGSVLLKTFGECLGKDFTLGVKEIKEIKEAWSKVYSVMADVMIKASSK